MVTSLQIAVLVGGLHGWVKVKQLPPKDGLQRAVQRIGRTFTVKDGSNVD